MSTPFVSARNLCKTYRLGRTLVPVLRGVDLDVHPGELVVILGSSGSGKSTLLHLLAGLDRPTPFVDGGREPTIRVGERELTKLSQGELDAYRGREVGLVFQFYHLLPELTVLENVVLAALTGRAASDEARTASVRQRALDLLATLGLSHRVGHRPVELSGGERQRVAIARALINDPPLLLADEPTGNLDSATGATVLDALLDLRRRNNRTMVIVTHDAATAARADRVVRLVDGVIVPNSMPSPATVPVAVQAAPPVATMESPERLTPKPDVLPAVPVVIKPGLIEPQSTEPAAFVAPVQTHSDCHTDPVPERSPTEAPSEPNILNASQGPEAILKAVRAALSKQPPVV